MTTMRRIKTGVAIMLSASLALPLSTTTSCSAYVAPDGRTVAAIPLGADSNAYDRPVSRHYAWSDLSPREPGNVLLLLAFLWPLPGLAYARVGKPARVKALAWWSEPLLAAGAAWLIWTVATLFADPAAGAYSGTALNANKRLKLPSAYK